MAGPTSGAPVTPGSSPRKLVLKVHFQGDSPTTYRTVQFDAGATVRRAVELVAHKCAKLKTAEARSLDEFGLLVAWGDHRTGGRWLDDGHLLGHCNLFPKSIVYFKCKFRHLQVTDLACGSRKKVMINDADSLKNAMPSICRRYGITDPSEFGLQVQQGEKSRWLSLEKTLVEQGVSDLQPIVFRKKFFVTDAFVSVREPALLHLIYLECRHAIVEGIYPITFEQAVHFSALQMQITFGNYDPLSHVAGFLDIHDFLPPRYRSTPFIEEDVYREHRRLMDIDELDVKNRYLRACMKLPTYGATFRAAKEIATEEPFEQQLLVGVNLDAILVMQQSSERSIVGRNLLLEVLGVTSYGNEVIVRLKGRHRVFAFDSEENGQLMYSLIVGYKDFQRSKKREHMIAMRMGSTVVSPQSGPFLLGSPSSSSMIRIKSKTMIGSPNQCSISPIDTSMGEEKNPTAAERRIQRFKELVI